MLLRKWVAVAACLVALAGPTCVYGQGSAQQDNRQQQNANSKNAEPKPSQPEIRGTTVESKASDQGSIQAQVYQPNCNEPKNHDEADFCVQRRVAEAAESTFQLTQLQTAIGAVGLLFVVITLGVTAWTGKAAAVAAQAAVDAVGAERAWMTMAGHDVKPGSGIVDGQYHERVLLFSIAMVNAGRSPAIKCMLNRQGKLIDWDGEIPEFELSNDSDFAANLGPGSAGSCNQFAVTGGDIDLLLNRRKQLAFHLVIDYETIGAPGVNRVTEICGKFTYAHDARTKNGLSMPVFTFIPAGPQNRVS